MGGENDLRGYDIRSISPVTFIPTETSQTIAFTDPDEIEPAWQSHVTRFITCPDPHLSGHASWRRPPDFRQHRIPHSDRRPRHCVSLFLDGGTDGIVRTDALKLNPAGLTNLQAAFPGANVSGQLPIAGGTNFRLRGSTGIEFGVQLPIVQAPFRIYYAYNLNRLHSEIISPPDYINPSELKLLQDTLPTEVYNIQVLPLLQEFSLNPGRLNYFEPKTTFRFTVGKTF